MFIRTRHYSRFMNRDMLQENALDFYGTHPNTADFQHVIRASGIPEVAVVVLIVFVTGANPMAFDGVLGLLVLVPVISADRVGLHDQIANLSWRKLSIVVIDNASLETGYHLSTRAGTHMAGTVGDHHM